MKRPEDIIKRPIVTERSSQAISEGKYTFEVDIKATKIDIKYAVEKLFNVKVTNVRTMKVLGKQKRVGVHQGKTNAWKKAIVTIDTNPADEKYLTKGGKEVKVAKKYNTEITEISSAFASEGGNK